MTIKCERKYFYNGNIQYEEYFKDGKRHKESLLAVKYYFEDGNKDCEYYYKDGMIHREDGPAVIFYYRNGKIEGKDYYLNNIRYTNKDIINNWEAFCKMQIFR